MKTPRIEGMIEEFETKWSEFTGHNGGFYEPMVDEIDKDVLLKWLRQALTQAHQAGIDEAVEVVKSLIDHQAEYGGQPFGDIYNSAYKKVIKALQDNK